MFSWALVTPKGMNIINEFADSVGGNPSDLGTERGLASFHIDGGRADSLLPTWMDKVGSVPDIDSIDGEDLGEEPSDMNLVSERQGHADEPAHEPADCPAGSDDEDVDGPMMSDSDEAEIDVDGLVHDDSDGDVVMGGGPGAGIIPDAVRE